MTLEPKHNANQIQGFPESMVLLDVETTGGKATKDRIIEIGLLVVEQGVLVKEWQTLVDPQTAIPPWITKLTGIRREMLIDAPTFEEIAPVIQGVCEGRVLVAHNARFDYGFLKNEFKRLEQNFQVKTLCSVKLSRQFYPQYPRHGLDQIIQRLGVEIQNRHRALDDTRVIWQFLQKISADFSEDDIEAVCYGFLQKPAIPAHLDADRIMDLPNRPGIYRFWQEDKLLYVGKSVRIRDRVMSHFTQDHAVAKDLQMSGKITDIDYEETPSDFGAQLLESRLVKQLRPQHNQKLKKLTKLYQVALREDAQGYLRCELTVAQQEFDSPELTTFGLFRSRRQAQAWMEKACSKHQLCGRLMGLENKDSGPCFAMQLRKCMGACCGKEPQASYNLRMQTAFGALKQQVWPWDEPVVVIERSMPSRVLSKKDKQPAGNLCHFHLIDQWRHLKQFNDVQALYDYLEMREAESDEVECFDLDAYLILIRFLLKTPMIEALQVVPLSQLLANRSH